jgi:sugar phosphate isomerase/epimerase
VGCKQVLWGFLALPERPEGGKVSVQAVDRYINMDRDATARIQETHMKLGLINSAWAQAGRDTSFGIRMTKEIGFDTIDIFTDPLDIDIRERRLIKRECDRVGLPIVSICCVAVGLIDFNPSVQNFHLERCKAFLDLVYEYEARNLLLVLGEYIWQQEVIPPADQWGLAVKHLRSLGDHAEKLGIQIALELEPFQLSLLNNIESMERFIDETNHPAVKANIDISHMLLSRTPPEALRRLKGKAIHVHISDCDGKKHGDLPPGRGVVPFAPYLQEIHALGLEGAMSIELEYSPEPDKIVDWVKEAYRETDRLMRTAKLRA